MPSRIMQSIAALDLYAFSDADGLSIQGDTDLARSGRSVSTAGDVDGDGFSDLVIGAYAGSDGGNGAGEAYVVFCGAVGRSTSPVTNLGTGSAEIFIGGLGDDTLVGGGGVDLSMRDRATICSPSPT